jgi:1,4-alpha-glucan branching enzyme
MGQEWGAEEPFLYFCDFEPGLAPDVCEGRREEFASFPEFADSALRTRIPDPNAAQTFASAVLGWGALDSLTGRRWLTLHRELLTLRAHEIAPRLPGTRGGQTQFTQVGERALVVRWRLDGAELELEANLDDMAVKMVTPPQGRLLWATPGAHAALAAGILPAWSVAWYLIAETAAVYTGTMRDAEPLEA